MGSNFVTHNLDGKLAKAEVKKAFTNLQDDDRYENGHSYSGGFGMASGLTYSPMPLFFSEDDAYEWLSDNARKWDNALCVRFKTNTGEQWMIGASCAC